MPHFVPYPLPQEAKGKIASLRGQMAANRAMLALCRFELLLRKAGFNPSQPRVPRGSSDGGRWTGGGGAAGAVLSDATPENFWKPGSRVAQADSRGRGSLSLRIGPQTFEVTPAQAMRYMTAETASRALTAQVRQVDPNWRPTPSLTESVEGEISARRAEAEEARAKLAQLARLPPKDLIEAYRSANNSYDLFGRETWPRGQGTIAVTTLNRTTFFGVNSGAPPLIRQEISKKRKELPKSLLESPPKQRARII